MASKGQTSIKMHIKKINFIQKLGLDAQQYSVFSFRPLAVLLPSCRHSTQKGNYFSLSF